MPDEPAEQHISPERTWLPLGIVATTVLAVAGGAVFLNSQLMAINYTMASFENNMDSRLTTIEARLDAAAEGMALKAEVRGWIELYRAYNPEASIPEFP